SAAKRCLIITRGALPGRNPGTRTRSAYFCASLWISSSTSSRDTSMTRFLLQVLMSMSSTLKSDPRLCGAIADCQSEFQSAIANLKSAIFWCERGELNPHPLRDWILSPARLPVPPLSHTEDLSNPTQARNVARAVWQVKLSQRTTGPDSAQRDGHRETLSLCLRARAEITSHFAAVPQA